MDRVGCVFCSAVLHKLFELREFIRRQVGEQPMNDVMNHVMSIMGRRQRQISLFSHSIALLLVGFGYRALGALNKKSVGDIFVGQKKILKTAH